MKIYLKSGEPAKAAFLQDSITIVEKVDSLIDFRNVDPNGQWILRQTDIGRLRHPDEFNNWCTSEFSDSVQVAMDKFYNWSLSAENGSNATLVSLNDMSLRFGGRFDISGRWDGRNSGYHQYHRVGSSVDVNQTLSTVQLRKLTRYLEQSGIERNDERPQIHYGSNGGN